VRQIERDISIGAMTHRAQTPGYDLRISPRAPRPSGDQPAAGGAAQLAGLRAAIMIGMIHEYARHIAHADIVRELIDGVTGE
jgi:Protein of unknown function (DUF664)